MLAAVASCALKNRRSETAASMRSRERLPKRPEDPLPDGEQQERRQAEPRLDATAGEPSCAMSSSKSTGSSPANDGAGRGAAGGFASGFSTRPRTPVAVGAAPGPRQERASVPRARAAERALRQSRPRRRARSIGAPRPPPRPSGSATARRRDGLVGVQRASAGEKNVLGLGPLGSGTQQSTGQTAAASFLIMESDALRALLGDDVEDVVRQRRMHRPVLRLPFDSALVDGGVRALGSQAPQLIHSLVITVAIE